MKSCLRPLANAFVLIAGLCLLHAPAMADFALTPALAKLQWTDSIFLHMDQPAAQAQFLKFAQNPYTAQYPYLLPAKAKVVVAKDNREIQAWVDSNLKQIFSTPTGRQICQHATGGDSLRLQTLFGASVAGANALTDICGPASAWTPIEKREYPRQYVVIYSNELTPLEGWTNGRGVTYLFFNPATTDLEARRTLIHELATKLDQKNMLGWMGLDVVARGQYNMVHPKHSACEINQFLANPYLKYAFSAKRAQAMEDQILAELGVTTPVFNQLVVTSARFRAVRCGVSELNSLPALFKSSAVFSTETWLNQTENSLSDCQDLKLTDPGTLLSSWFDFLNGTQVIGSDGSRARLCAFLEAPSWGTFHFTAFEGGPRPRVGEGWLPTHESANVTQAPLPNLHHATEIQIPVVSVDQAVDPNARARQQRLIDMRMSTLSMTVDQGGAN